MNKALTFEECIKISSAKKHLVLGNGFSIDLFPNIFNYKKLAEKITDPNIQAIFKEFNTSDFEFVVLKLTESLRVLSYYDTNKNIFDKVKFDAERLKDILISVISEAHPENPTAITENQFKSCYDFLRHFEEGRKYTFNYDLILYWVYMHFLEDTNLALKSDDGFRTSTDNDSMVTWEIGREHQQNLYYLHGAMHIFKDSYSSIQKYTWRNGDKTIGQQIRESIDDNKFPVFISEGTTEHKLKRIKENGYLARSFSSLKSISGDLFIFGHSIRDEDDHVFEIINSNRSLKKIFISAFGSLDSDSNKKKTTKIESWKKDYTSKGREYILYDSSSTNVWKKYDI